MGFKRKKLWKFWNFSDLFSWLRESFINMAFSLKLFLVILSFGILFHLSSYAIDFWRGLVNSAVVTFVQTMSSTVGEEMSTDKFGQVNALLLWADEWNLADSIIVASFVPDEWLVSMLSIPRDLYVENSSLNYQWRINWIIPTTYNRTDSLEEWIWNLSDTINDITWVEIDYYAMIDFDWFVNFIDKIWWIQVDVPYSIVDNQFPTPDGWYQTFKVDEWLQQFDGEKALKYARSRQTTSDFSRAERQQLIISGIIDELKSMNVFTDFGQLQDLYAEVNQMVDTNISYRQIFGMINYVDDINWIHTQVLTADCERSHYTVMEPWCFLYYPRRDNFGWHSVLLQQWANAGNFSNYKEIQNYAFFVLHNQWFLQENSSIEILNWISRQAMLEEFQRVTPVASNFAKQLVKYWFNIKEVDNYEDDEIEENIIYTNSKEDNKVTLNLLRMFMEVGEIIEDPSLESDIQIVLSDNFL